MLPRRLRLPRQRIDVIFRKGKKTGNDRFTIRFTPRPAAGNPESRFCVIISATVQPSAVKRNRLRRQIHEIIRINEGILPAGMDVIVIGKKKLAADPYGELKANLISLLKKPG